MRRRNAIHNKPKPLDKVAEIIKSDAKSDLHDRQIGLTEQTRRLLDSQELICWVNVLRNYPEKVLKYCGDNPNSAATADIGESGSVKCSPR